MSPAMMKLFLARLACFVALLSAVLTVIYFTPVPDLYFASCERPCHELDWPMICRFKLTLELHNTMPGWCGDCSDNGIDCFKKGCNVRRIIAVNGQQPGPNMQVCENDIMVVDVVNRIPGGAASIHWRGQLQTGTPFMDGVPMITQCPIQPYTTFQYKFRASQHGTHLWQAMTGDDLMDNNVFGALIVRKSDRTENLKSLYDEDKHLLVVSLWSGIGIFDSSENVKHDLLASISNPFTILVNGIPANVEDLIPRLSVDSGRRYRIRVVYPNGGPVSFDCPLFISVEGHSILTVALDGNYMSPVNVSTAHIAPGERLDFILQADKQDGTYGIEIASNCTSAKGLAILEYNSTFAVESTDQPLSNRVYDESISYRKKFHLITTSLRDDCTDPESDGTICINNINSANKMPGKLAKTNTDVKLYLPFDLVRLQSTERSHLGDIRGRISNITMSFPTVPVILSDEGEIGLGECRKESVPKQCTSFMKDTLCKCLHVINIPLSSSVEINLFHQGGDDEEKTNYVFHLHGHKFYVVAATNKVPNYNGNIEEAQQFLQKLDRQGKLFNRRNLDRPVLKDTVAVPRRGAVAVRFTANNPGCWLLHEQSNTFSGLGVILRVGKRSDLPSPPDNFPTCGNWVGPDFFLI